MFCYVMLLFHYGLFKMLTKLLIPKRKLLSQGITIGTRFHIFVVVSILRILLLYCSVEHTSQALVSSQAVGKKGKRVAGKSADDGDEMYDEDEAGGDDKV